MELRQRGVELLMDVLVAAEHVERMKATETKELLTEIGALLGPLLKRDIPEDRPERRAVMTDQMEGSDGSASRLFL